MNKVIYILRGVSGSGKTTLAKTLEKSLPHAVSYAADDYHYDSEGNYNFKFENLNEAHKSCQANVKFAMENDWMNIVVHNTSTTEKEMKPYLDLAEKYGYDVVSLVVENRHGNKDVHNVPDNVRKIQEGRLKSNLKLI